MGTDGQGWHPLVTVTRPGNRAGIVERVDYRGQGGHIAAGPSVHPDAHAYARINPDLRDLTYATEWFSAALAPPVVERTPVVLRRDPDAYSRASLARELERVLSAAEGTRNHTLNRVAFSLGQLVGRGDSTRRTSPSSSSMRALPRPYATRLHQDRRQAA